MLYKDTKEGKQFKEEMDKKFRRKEVTREELRILLNSLNFKQILGLCSFSKDDLIDIFLLKDDKDLDDCLFTYYSYIFI
ncbi:MAG: hypothetical protein ACFFG0_49325 [Candidatus Thorarchaeota archaeon]